MNNFLKPSFFKIVILFVLVLVSTLFSPAASTCQPTSYGFPLKFFQFGECVNLGPCIETTEPGPYVVCESTGFHSLEGIPSLAINVIFWYLISSIIVRVYTKIRSGA